MSVSLKGNPDELERFIAALINYVENITEETEYIRQEHERLSETWQDNKSARFEEDFEQLIRAMETFRNSAEEQIPILQYLLLKMREYQEG